MFVVLVLAALLLPLLYFGVDLTTVTPLASWYNRPPSWDPGRSSRSPLSPSWAITPKFKSDVEQLPWRGHGAALGVVGVTREGVVHTDFTSWGTVSDRGDPINKDTLFAIGTASKPVLSSAMGILMDDFASGRNTTPLPQGVGAFTWDTRIRELLPDESDWMLVDPDASENATVRDVLTQVVGITGHNLAFGVADTSLDVVRRLRYLPPTYPFRREWSPSHEMYVLGAYLISTYSGMPYTQFVRGRVFDPVGMISSTFSSNEAALSGNMSLGWGNGRQLPVAIPEAMAETMAGSNALISSADDMMKWIATLLNDGVAPHMGIQVIPLSAMTESMKAHVPAPSISDHVFTSTPAYGMGWVRASYHGHDIVSSWGAVSGHRAYIALFPAERLGVVVLVQEDHIQMISEDLAVSVAGPLLGLPATIPRRLEHGMRPHEPGPVVMGFATLNTTPLPLPPQSYNQACPSSEDMLRSAVPSASLEDYEGTYHSPAYGTLSLCASAANASSPSRQAIFANFTVSFGVPLGPNTQTLYAAWPRLFATHVEISWTWRRAWRLRPVSLHGGLRYNEKIVQWVTSSGTIVAFELYDRMAALDGNPETPKILFKRVEEE